MDVEVKMQTLNAESIECDQAKNAVHTQDELTVPECNKGDVTTDESKWENKQAWLILVYAFICKILISNVQTSFGVYYVELIVYFGASTGSASLIESLRKIASVPAGFIIGTQIDLFQPRFLLMMCTSLVIVGFFLSSFAPELYELTLVYGIIVGVGYASLHSCMTKIVQSHFSRNRSLAASISWAGASISGIVSPMIVYFLISTYGWRWSMRIQAVVYVNVLPLAWIMRIPEKRSSTSNNTACQKFLANFKGLFSMCLTLNFTVITVVNMLKFFTMTVFLIHTVARGISYGINRKWASFLLTITFIVDLVARLLFIPCVNHKKSNPLLAKSLFMALMGAAHIVSVFGQSLHFIIATQVIFGIGMGVAMPLTTVVNVLLFDVSRLGRVNAIGEVLNAISAILAITLAGYLYDITGSYTLPFLMSGVSTLVAAILLVFLYFINKRKREISANRKNAYKIAHKP